MINDKYTPTSLLSCVIKEDIHTLHYFPDYVLISSEFDSKNTILHYASQISLEVCKALLPRCKTILNKKNILGYTAIHYSKNEAIRNYLLEEKMKI